MDTLASPVQAARNFTIPRSSYLPPQARGTDPITPEGTDLAIWKYESPNSSGAEVFYAIAFAGKANKPLWHHWYRNEAQRQRAIDDTIESRLKTLEFKNKRKQDRLDYRHDYKEGDILYASWGYDQTNIDFYQVTKVLSPTMIEIREIEEKLDHAERGVDYMVAVPNRFTGPPMRKKVSPGGSVKLTSFSSASKWDGKPKYQTPWDMGH